MVDVNYYIEIAGGIVIHLQAGIVHLNYGSVPFPFATFCVCGWTPPLAPRSWALCVICNKAHLRKTNPKQIRRSANLAGACGRLTNRYPQPPRAAHTQTGLIALRLDR